jgi:hypothetical protein
MNEENFNEDGIEEAMNEIAKDIKPTRRRSTGTKEGDTANQVLIRTSPESHQRWKDAAEKQGVSMAEFVRRAADTAAKELLDCPHPAESRRWYPWAETCMKCGKALRDRSGWLVDPSEFPHVRPANAFDAKNPKANW